MLAKQINASYENKQPFLLAPRRLGRFSRRNVCYSRQKFHTDDVNLCLHNKFGSHGVPHANMFKCCVHLRTSSSKIQMLQFDCFVTDSLRLYMTFAAFCLTSVIRKQWLEQHNYSDFQSALMIRFQTDFTSSVWNFCRWVADVLPRETYPSGDERGETSVFASCRKLNLASAIW